MLEEDFTPAETTDNGKHRWKKTVKMALPHVGLGVLLFLYLLIGASIFNYLEYEADVKIQKAKLDRLKTDYKNVVEAVRDVIGDEENFAEYEPLLFKQLSKLSTLHEGRYFELDPGMLSEDALSARWTKSSSFLYALSILTTTGYAYAVPVTGLGQCFAIAYGLVGIPLMVLAAVDIGKFLSHIVLEAYAKYLKFLEKIGRKKRDMSLKRKRSRLGKDGETAKMIDDAASSDVGDADKASTPPERRLPLVINASILLVFCMLGGILYIAAGGKATFIEAFFVTFNLVANLTMSEMPNDLNHILTIMYIFVFVTCGVAVLSMSAELAALELKEIFMKIHYFGRKINFKRNKKKDQMEMEVKELLKIIEEIRRRYPDKEKITTRDILEYMHENNAAKEKLQERRDTIAFMPQTMEMLKFADEQDLEDRSVRGIDEPFIDKTLTMVDVLELSTEIDLEHRFHHELRKYTAEIKMMPKPSRPSLSIEPIDDV
ncbi:unnamed protein product [Caenorhabditis auriculariae]|uniref:Potassium channel domain-containing protein n=1 Tax=Caenorhabditis auriculariae TaxID=2777116 RepID=A0A8S1HNF0_9PELO|nr:unnamed protein product [Caenorhabditis auriculariae]